MNTNAAAPAPAATRRNNHNNTNHGSMNVIEKWLGIAASLLRILLWPIRRLSLLVFPPSELDGLSPAVTAKATQQFASYLQSLQATFKPNPHQLTSSGLDNNDSADASQQQLAVTDLWHAAGFAAAREQALQSQSLLMVYLHSPLHWQAEAFCKSVLLHASLKQFCANPGVVAIGCSVHSAQGAQLQQAVQATALPCLVLLQPSRAASTVQLLFRAQGPKLLDLVQLPAASTSDSSSRSSSSSSRASSSRTTATAVEQKLVPYLQTALHKHQAVLAEQTARRLQQEEESNLRRQQDEEFAAALQADQERERQRAEQAAAQAAEQAAAQAAQQQAAAAAAAKVQAAQAKVQPEPAAGGAAAAVANIRFVLPSGAKLNRRFGADETVGALRAFLFLHFQDQPGVMENIGLSTNFPRTTYNSESDDSKTLREAGLVPQAVLMVQDLDA